MTDRMPRSARGAETPALIMTAMIATLEDELLPQLTESQARAAAASMAQVLAQLARTVAWDPAPLAERLHVRRAKFDGLAAELGATVPALAKLPALPADTGSMDAGALARALDVCDAYVSSLAPIARKAADEGSPQLERWLLAYCRQAADVDLRFMTPSHLGRLTRKTGPKRPRKDAP